MDKNTISTFKIGGTRKKIKVKRKKKKKREKKTKKKGTKKEKERGKEKEEKVRKAYLITPTGVCTQAIPYLDIPHY